jgi:hypothetical protein
VLQEQEHVLLLNVTGFWYGNMKERDSFADLGVDGKIILKWMLKK